MDQATRRCIRQEAIRIGDDLLARAEPEGRGICWPTMDLGNDRKITWGKSPYLYSGVTGIALFLAELNRLSREPKYLEAARSALDWVEEFCQKKPPQNRALYTGLLGICFTYLRMHQITGETAFLHRALDLVKPGIDKEQTAYRVDDLINGTSGMILGFLHLHAATGQRHLLETIDGLIEKLLAGAHQGRQGLYWDRSPESITGLCGFSHGAAGIGLVFLELGHYFRNPTFDWLADQAFLHESRFFDREKKNWLDLRQGAYTDEDKKNFRQAYLAGDIDFFTRGTEMNAWCHGAPGIGLSRLRAFELKNETHFKREALTALEKTLQVELGIASDAVSFTLCHGRGGNAEIFLEAFRRFGREKYWQLAIDVAQRAIAMKKRTNLYFPGLSYLGEPQEDNSLFLGTAGIAYFYLRVLDPHGVPSLLLPGDPGLCPTDVDLSGFPHISLTLAQAREKLVEKYFKRTLCLADRLLPGKVSHYFQSEMTDRKKSQNHRFISFIREEARGLGKEQGKRFSEVFCLERDKVKMDLGIKSLSYLNIQYEVLAEKAEELIRLDMDQFLALRLTLNAACRLKQLRWDWDLGIPGEWPDNLDKEPDTFPLLLKPEPLGVAEVRLSPFSFTLFQAFAGGNRVGTAMKELIDAFETLTPEEEESIREKAVEQMVYALKAGVLYPADDERMNRV